MKSNQVDVLAAAMPGDLQQVFHAVKPGFLRQIFSNVVNLYRHNRIHDDVAIFHRVTAIELHMRMRPDANAAPDSSAPDSFAKAFGENHTAP